MAGLGLDSLCNPALVYLGISAVSVLYMFYMHRRLESMILKIVFAALWVWLLNFLCAKGLEPLSWILVIIPFIFMAFLVAFVVAILESSSMSVHTATATAMMNRGQVGYH